MTSFEFIAMTSHKLAQLSVTLFCHLLMRVGFRFEVKGRQHLPESGPVIFAGSHTGWLDAPAVIVAVGKPVVFMVGEMALDWPVIRQIIACWPHIPVGKGRERSGLRQAIRQLLRGDSICIFPEGKLSENGDLGSFQQGVAFLQHHAQVPVVPFYIDGGFAAWHWGQWIPRAGKITLHFGEPLRALPQSDHKSGGATDKLFQAVQELEQQAVHRLQSA